MAHPLEGELQPPLRLAISASVGVLAYATATGNAIAGVAAALTLVMLNYLAPQLGAASLIIPVCVWVGILGVSIAAHFLAPVDWMHTVATAIGLVSALCWWLVIGPLNTESPSKPAPQTTAEPVELKS